VNDSIQYFEALYHHNNDPWGYDHHWYEARKRQICLALLTQQHYSSVLEIGCSNGHLSVHLAQRAGQLLCLDLSAHAVHWASQRLQDLGHVNVQQQKIPENFPQQKFDLIVISEVAYYLSRNELHKLINQLKDSLTPQGEILCCHWRHAIQDFELDAFQVHDHLKQSLPFSHYLSLNDPDFMIDIWTVNSSSLAKQQGLI
jgi:cyclopropane fatty-acyl-phospholipid synthase-like methyltransferase